eukprot:903556-Rhodomonas_salina.1
MVFATLRPVLTEAGSFCCLVSGTEKACTGAESTALGHRLRAAGPEVCAESDGVLCGGGVQDLGRKYSELDAAHKEVLQQHEALKARWHHVRACCPMRGAELRVCGGEQARDSGEGAPGVRAAAAGTRPFMLPAVPFLRAAVPRMLAAVPFAMVPGPCRKVDIPHVCREC